MAVEIDVEIDTPKAWHRITLDAHRSTKVAVCLNPNAEYWAASIIMHDGAHQYHSRLDRGHLRELRDWLIGLDLGAPK